MSDAAIYRGRCVDASSGNSYLNQLALAEKRLR
jgi:hypothetical protein